MSTFLLPQVSTRHTFSSSRFNCLTAATTETHKMRQRVQEAATRGDLTIFDQIRSGEISDAYILPTNHTSYNAIHTACANGQEEFIREAVSVIKPHIVAQLIAQRNGQLSNALHEAAWYGCTAAVKVLVDFYKRWTLDLISSSNHSSIENGRVVDHQDPWILTPNRYAKTPLHDALDRGHDEMACYIFLLDPVYLYDKVNEDKESPLYLGVKNRCHRFLELILSSDFNLPATSVSFSAPHGRTALHQAIIDRHEDGIVRKMLEKLINKDEIVWQFDSKGWTALHYAIAEGVDWQIELLLQRPPTSNFFKFNQNSESPLLLAWKCGHHSAIPILLRLYPAMIEWRSETNTTLLHCIKLQNKEQYQELLKIPEMQRVVNVADINKMTPLHQAIFDGNFILTELLFNTNGVNKTAQNNEGKTPIDMLVEKSSQSAEFADLRKRPGIIPRASYLSIRADLKEVRSTVMVVAALLATITFQAAFTIPDATKNRTIAFIIFLVADTGAMCCSLVVLFWLIWAMVEDDYEKSRKLADRSFFMLEVSFYMTLIAFTAAVFGIASDKSVALAIVLTAICCTVPVLSSKGIVSRIFKAQKTQLELP